MARINQNELAVATCELEGRKHNQPISEVKEVQRCTWECLLRDYTDDEIAAFLARKRKQLAAGKSPH